MAGASFLLRIWFCSLLILLVNTAPPSFRDDRQIQPPAGKAEAENDKKERSQIQMPAKQPKKIPELVKRPDHLEGVPIERDGHLNKKFRQEAFLGKDTNEEMMKTLAEAEGKSEPLKLKKTKSPEDTLEEAFRKADFDKDGKLSWSEMMNHIRDTTLQHLDEAVQESSKIFELIDQDSDGLLTWDEYHYHFLIDNKIMDPAAARVHKEEDHHNLKQDRESTVPCKNTETVFKEET